MTASAKDDSAQDDKASAEQSGTGQDADQTTAEAAGQEDDDLHRRYREALERKQSHDSAGSGSRSGPAKSSGGGGSAHTSRMFRRKAGG